MYHKYIIIGFWRAPIEITQSKLLLKKKVYTQCKHINNNGFIVSKEKAMLYKEEQILKFLPLRYS